LVMPALAFAFLAVGAQLVTTIASDSLFVSTFSLGALSRFLIVSSIVRVFVAFGYAGLSTRLGGARLDALVLAATAVEAAASGFFARSDAPVAIYAVCSAQLLLPPLLPLIAVNAAMSCFHTRQAKRLLPLVAAAGTVGSMAVGAVARGLATWLGTSALLYVGALLCVVSIPFPALLGARAREAGTDDAPPPKPGGPREGFFTILTSTLRDVREVPVVRVVVGNAVLAAAAVAVVQFAFKAALKAHYGRDEMAGFIGMFSTVSEAVVLVAQLFVTSRFVARFGVRVSLESLPASLVAFGPLVVFLPGVASATGARFANDVLRFALGGPTSDLLLTPAPGAVRTRAKVFVKGLAAPLGGTLAGVALNLFGEAGPSPAAMASIFVVTGVLGVIFTRGAKRAYTGALAAAIGEGRVLSEVSPASAAVLRSELARLLREGAAKGDVAQVEKVLAVMSDKLFSLADLEPALASPSTDVRRAALKVALRLARPGDGARLLAAVPEGSDAEL
ncbi:MAG TPA: hypothetical protein VHB21_23370, partial [Minicystis sp.]|nr:hypothetical protein [Minicystis sp.]